MPALSPTTRAECPACQRYTGPLRDCPYCGLDSPDRPLRRILQRSALALASLGLILLTLPGLLRSPPLQHIGQLRPVMNYGRVTLSGEATFPPGQDNTTAAPRSFELTDGTGGITVIVPHHLAGSLPTLQSPPTLHQPMQVSGQLLLAAGKRPRLYMASAMTGSTCHDE